MTKYEAKGMDEILRRFTPEIGRIQLFEKEECDLCDKLEGLGYLEIVSRDNGYHAWITDSGKEVNAKNGIETMFKENSLDRKGKKWGLAKDVTAIIVSIIALLISVVSLVLAYSGR